ncbi:hypothetical protein TNCV_2084331 [Trichonephila clavipes]|uniref:Uncharacterized protein n=1 Tax=Trichonephila clavipes TaxID=2585209 RepID=A0A8X6V634_TRICX|nr:hypothetical protein TNCV_2084331 [Trichonephila clavipes]
MPVSAVFVMDVCSPIFKLPEPILNFAITYCFSAINFCYVAMDVCSRHVSRSHKTDNRPRLILGGRFNHLKHFKEAQRSLRDCYRAGNGAIVFAQDAGQRRRDSLWRTRELGNDTCQRTLLNI